MSENKNPTAPSALVLDVCCGPRSMWFNKKDTRAVFVDCRKQAEKAIAQWTLAMKVWQERIPTRHGPYPLQIVEVH